MPTPPPPRIPNNPEPRRWSHLSSKLRGALDGLGIAVPTAAFAYWMGTWGRAELGYNISLVTVGFFFAIYLLRVWIIRKLREIKRREEELTMIQEALRESVAPLHRFEARVASAEEATSLWSESNAYERLEKWLGLIDKNNRTLFRIGRWICGMGCVGASIAILIAYHGEHSWGGTLLLGTGSALLGSPTVFEALRRRKKNSRGSRKPE